MSQAKVDRYKKEKANRKKTIARNKVKRFIGMVCAWVIVFGLVGWAGYSGYTYYEDNKPAKSFYCDTTALTDYVSGLTAE